MSSRVWSRKSIKEKFSISSPPFPILAAMIALVVGGVIGMFETPIWGGVVGAITMAVIVLLRQDELATTVVIAVRLYLDWYLGLGVIAQIMALLLLLIFFLARSPHYPWVEPRALWLWILLLILAIFPAIRGISLADGIYYYSNIIFSALIIFWLGIVIGRDSVHVRRFLKIFSAFGTLLAIHAIIQTSTGAFLLASPRYDAYLATVANFELSGATSSAYRIGSFFVNPDSSGAFFAIMILLPLGLFVESSALLEKILYFAEMFIMALGLLFTYSTVGWVAALIGIVVFILLVGSMHYRILLALIMLGIAVAIMIYFPSQVNLLLQHTNSPRILLLRIGAWQTGIQVIHAFPLAGIGLGRYVYIQRADPYRVPAQYIPLYHPHNSYLELAALGGLPLLIVFGTLLLFALQIALRNWIVADVRTRSLLGGGIAAVMALSVNSLANPGWTLAPLAATGWLILGVISSPLLTKNLISEKGQESNNNMIDGSQ